MIVVHHLNDSRSQRILWLLEELGVDYRIEPYQRDAQTRLAPDALRQVHALGKSPVITDGEFTTAMVLILAALALMRISFAVQDADERAHRKVHKEPQNTVKGKRKVG